MAPVIAAVAVALGFALLSLPVIQNAFDALATLLASVSAFILGLAGYDITQTGTELRDQLQGFAIEVTEACDGHGLIISWAAILMIVRATMLKRLIYFAVGFLVVQIFNLIRIVVLYVAAPAGTTLFDTFHFYLFPLLTALMLVALVTSMMPRLRPQAVLVAVLSSVLAVAWYFAGEPITVVTALPLAEWMNVVLGYAEIGQISNSDTGWRIGSQLVQSQEPLRLYISPLYPADFTLAMPLLIAAVVVVRSGYLYLVLAILGMVVALSLGSHTEIWNIALLKEVKFSIVSLGNGKAALTAYEPPSNLVIDCFRLMQNTIVHLILLVLPALILIYGVERDRELETGS